MKQKNTKKIKIFIASIIFSALPLPLLAQSEGEVYSMSLSGVATGLLLLAVVIGLLYNLHRTTKVYGGLIGEGMNRLGVGILFFSVEALDRVSRNFGGSGLLNSIMDSRFVPMFKDFLVLCGLFFIALGFSKLSSAIKKITVSLPIQTNFR